MSEQAEIRRDTSGTVHRYGWLATHVPLLVAASWTLLLIGAVVALAVRFGAPRFSWALVALGSIWLGLVALAFWGQKNSNRRLTSVAVDSAGLWFRRGTNAAGEFVSWGQIESAEMFSYPDRDALYIPNKSGLRVRVRDRQFFIYEHIAGYRDLLEQIRSNITVQ